MAVTIRYRPNNRDFGRLMMSDQTQDLADQGAENGVAYARAYAKGVRPGLPVEYIASIRAERGPAVTLGGNPRRTARTVAEHRLSAAIEFGTGQKRDRPQGGSSPAHRILGRAAARVGSPPFGSDA